MLRESVDTFLQVLQVLFAQLAPRVCLFLDHNRIHFLLFLFGDFSPNTTTLQGQKFCPCFGLFFFPPERTVHACDVSFLHNHIGADLAYTVWNNVYLYLSRTVMNSVKALTTRTAENHTVCVCLCILRNFVNQEDWWECMTAIFKTTAECVDRC